VRTIPNESILINTLALQEAKDSSAVENIITTHDELYKAELFVSHLTTPAAKEVQSYSAALKKGFDLVRENKLLTNNMIISVYQEIKHLKAGFRVTPGTVLKNESTGDIIYSPPQDANEIKQYMSNFEKFINDELFSDIDPLIKMAVIHHQFESIHPFTDGNGRTGRIINILYLVSKDLLEIPVLYLSRYIIRHKSEYYKLLQHVRDTNEWEAWVLFVLKGIEETSIETLQLIQEIKELMQQYKNEIRTNLPKIYSQDLLNNLFRHPYTKIEFIQRELSISRPTATAYLRQLVNRKLLTLMKIGRTNYYLNKPLFEVLINAFHVDANTGDSISVESVG
jgi:Fic family protein